MVDDPVVLFISSRHSIVFHMLVGWRKTRAGFLFQLFSSFWLFCQLTKLHLEVHISRQVVSPHVTVHIGQQTSVEFSLLFIHDTGRNEIKYIEHVCLSTMA